ncbi:hypothetical protein B0J18DRAFT_473488 [Chaetomium sp. MPI-SDFR-AT-0129]|nr:hypothetical protein B0J18DRAFT_473488 [Chaetomium sp. MPI-SDFR-AT-0129]
MTKSFKGAMHIVQMRLFPPYKERVVRGSARLRARPDYVPPNYEQAGNDKTGIMLLEYCPRGSLDKAIQAAVKKDMRFPTRGLWKLFQCLVKGCIAMAYEPGKYPTLYNGVGLHDEMMMPTATEEKTVHFDLDPQNVLVGANTAAGTAHSLFPVLKISDFGLAQYFNDEDLQEDYNMYSLRQAGKANFLTPEQFTGEWDYIPVNSGPGTVQTPNAIPVIAGNWSYKHNLFQVGWIMGCLLERSYPPVPPFAQRIAVPWRLVNPLYYHGEPNSYPTRYGPGEDTQARQHDGNLHPDGTRIPNTLDKVSAYSYGEYLVDHDSNKAHDHNRLDVDRVGPRLENRQDRGSPLPEPAPPMYADESFLRDLVAMCLCEKPYYRPSLTWLQKEIETFMEKFYGRIDEEDENNQENKDLRDFVREIFDRPPPPPPPPPPAAARKKRRNMKGKYPTDAQLAKDRKGKRQKKQEREAQLQAEQEARDQQRQLDEEEEQDGAVDGEQN